MDKQMIEEMEKDIAVRMAMAKGVAGSMNNGVEGWVSKYLIEIGYRKIPENAVVLTREEYEKVKHVLKYEPEEAIIRLEDLTKNERLYSPHMFCSLGGCSGVRKGCNRTCNESWIVIERKETAEKFAERLKSEVLNFCGTVEENGYFERGKISFCEDIDEICKELTEGKE